MAVRGTRVNWQGHFVDCFRSLCKLFQHDPWSYKPIWGEPPDIDKLVDMAPGIQHHRLTVPFLNASWGTFLSALLHWMSIPVESGRTHHMF